MAWWDRMRPRGTRAAAAAEGVPPPQPRTHRSRNLKAWKVWGCGIVAGHTRASLLCGCLGSMGRRGAGPARREGEGRWYFNVPPRP